MTDVTAQDSGRSGDGEAPGRPEPTRRPLRCAYVRVGQKVSKSVVAWRQQCKRTVKAGSRYCWQHDAMGTRGRFGLPQPFGVTAALGRRSMEASDV